ncbi:hypothetical protein F5878DRAFT_346493 [Lentinula raphanica]|uniref:Uncharacterized protein n=1 Tax=Lentinula raphanica TaxID=153919 RepID=A0AA38P219_9AGAR|nr:hypothetical protein F5878DRAFT_346493 [Lentinula raphanica]
MRSSVMSLALFLVMSMFMVTTRALPAGTPNTPSDSATVTFFYDSTALTVQQREYAGAGTEWAQQQKEAWGDLPPFKIATSRDHFADTTHGVYTVKSKICPSSEDCDSDHSVGATRDRQCIGGPRLVQAVDLERLEREATRCT